MTTVFTVEGMGEFPLDMLRYDQCYPHNSTDAANMSTTPFNWRRKVTLVTELRSAPTDARWASFLWRVTEITKGA